MKSTLTFKITQSHLSTPKKTVAELHASPASEQYLALYNLGLINHHCVDHELFQFLGDVTHFSYSDAERFAEARYAADELAWWIGQRIRLSGDAEQQESYYMDPAVRASEGRVYDGRTPAGRHPFKPGYFPTAEEVAGFFTKKEA